MGKKSNLFFLVLIMITTVLLTVVIIIKETNTISYEENRYLATFEELKDTSYLDNSFQESFENALVDQFVFRNDIVRFKRSFDYLTKMAMLSLVDDLTLNKMPGVNVNQIGNSDWMMNMIVEDTEDNRYRFKTFAGQINSLQQRHPDTEVYVYMPTQVHDTDVFDEANGIVGGGPALTKVFKDTLKVPYAEYEINNIDDYKKAYFKSDHHPNHVGADIFYREIHELMELQDDPFKPIYEDCHIGEDFSGTFARQTGFITAPEKFCIYQYDLPEMRIYEGNNLRDCPDRFDFEKLTKESLQEEYPYYYGIAYTSYEPIMHIETNNVAKGNLLIIGDSFSSSIVDLLASHFHNTYRVLPYKVDGGFNYDTYIEQNDIDKVLFMFTFENYYYQDEWGDRWQQNLIEEVNK